MVPIAPSPSSTPLPVKYSMMFAAIMFPRAAHAPLFSFTIIPANRRESNAYIAGRLAGAAQGALAAPPDFCYTDNR
jgi:hypothetical protein